MTQSSFLRSALTLLLLCASVVAVRLPALCQDTAATDADAASIDDMQMLVPPPVSGQSYPTEFAGETEENYWRGGFTLSSGYTSNITGGTNPVGDESYSFWGNLGLDRATAESRLVLNYSPGFTLYQHTSGYNQGNQSLTMNWQYRISPRLSVYVVEGFQKSSNIFNQPNPLSAAPVSGSVPLTGVAVVAPLADQISNATNAQITYQVGESSMLGISGAFGTLQYLNSEQATGLYNSQSTAGSAFYSRRLGNNYYLGVNYQYQNFKSFQTSLPGTRTQTQCVSAFLSVYLKPTLSVSITAGPQHYFATQPPFPPGSSWSPLVTVSGAWRGERTTVAASFSKIVSGAGGLSGVYHSTIVGASANWKVSRNWSTGVGASYGNNQSLTPLFLASAGGHTLLGTVSAQRTLGDHANLQFGYNWTNQRYEQIAAIAAAPNVNRVFISVNYQFTRPLHR
jgi:hypothetical protein